MQWVGGQTSNNKGSNSNKQLPENLEDCWEIREPYLEIENQSKYNVMFETGFQFKKIVEISDKVELVLLKGQNKSTREFVTINTFDLKGEFDQLTQEDKDKILKVILQHRRLTGHPLILDFVEVFTTTRYFCIVVKGPHEHSQNLYSYLTKRSPISEDEARTFFQQIILCQKLLHDNQIFLHHIQPENVCFAVHKPNQQKDWWHMKSDRLDPQHLMNLKTWDYQRVKQIFCNRKITIPGLPILSHFPPLLQYSPEYIQSTFGNDSFDGNKADVWACGVTLFFMLTRKQAYVWDKHYRRHMSLMVHFLLAEKELKFPKDCQVSVSCKILLKGMLDRSPKTRFSLQQVIDHPWFQKDLPQDWDRSFEEQMLVRQQQLQSEEEIKSVVEKLSIDMTNDIRNIPLEFLL